MSDATCTADSGNLANWLTQWNEIGELSLFIDDVSNEWCSGCADNGQCVGQQSIIVRLRPAQRWRRRRPGCSGRRQPTDGAQASTRPDDKQGCTAAPTAICHAFHASSGQLLKQLWITLLCCLDNQHSYISIRGLMKLLPANSLRKTIYIQITWSQFILI